MLDTICTSAWSSAHIVAYATFITITFYWAIFLLCAFYIIIIVLLQLFRDLTDKEVWVVVEDKIQWRRLPTNAPNRTRRTTEQAQV